MLRIHRFDWDFSSTAEVATGVLLALVVIVALLV
jgi:hypothetical protein